MDKKQDFLKIMGTIDSSTINDIEKKRSEKYEKVKKIRRMIFSIIGIALAVYFCYTTLYLNYSFEKALIMLAPFIPVSIFAIVISVIISAIAVAFNKKDNLLTDYKEKIIANMVNVIFPKAKYEYISGIQRSAYNSKGYRESYDRYSSEDLIVSEDNLLEFSEVHTEDEHVDEDGHTSYTTVFYGIAGRYILKDVKIDDIYVLLNRLFGGKDRVKLDSSEFEKIYDVFSKNDISSLKFLTLSTMEKIVALSKEYNRKFEFFIESNVLYFRIHEKNRLFEMKLSESVLEKQTYEHYLSLSMVKDIVELIKNSLD